VHAADGLVVRVEEIFEIRMKRAIAGEQRLQQELLEEPAGVREVPLGGLASGMLCTTKSSVCSGSQISSETRRTCE
jgi:hypothetical protein